MPSVDSDQSYTFTIEPKPVKENTNNLNNPLNNNFSTGNDSEDVYLQIALLYSHFDGSRRIRVFNYGISKCNFINEYFMSMDVESVASLLTKIFVYNLYTSKIMDQAVNSIQTMYYSRAMSNIGALTKSKNKNPNVTSMLNLPKYVLGMIKNRICCRDEIAVKMDIDLNHFLRTNLLKLNVEEVLNYICPSIYNLIPLIEMINNDNSISTNIGIMDENNRLVLPEIISNNQKNILKKSVYLIDNGLVLILYFTFDIKNKPDDEDIPILDFFFGSEIENIEINYTQLQNIILTEDSILYNEYRTNNEKLVKEKIINIIEYIRSIKTTNQNLLFVFEGTQLDRL
jgi:hypothetical protein